MADEDKGARAARRGPQPMKVSLGPLPGYIGYMLRQAQLTVFARFNAALSQFDLKPGQFSVLIVIDHNASLRATDVCNALGFQKANFAPLIRTLEQRGLVLRRDCERDRRTQTLQLTAAGKRLLARAMRAHDEFERELCERLGSSAARGLLDRLAELTQGP